jgi:hypothetical protein
MDYFTDLLESYSKLKKRTLKLLKESENPESDAQNAFQQAKTQNPPPSLAKPFVTNTSKGTQVAIYMKKDGSWKGSIFSNGKVLGGQNEVFIDQDFQRFVKFFTGEDTGNKTRKFEKTPAGLNIAGSEFAELNPEDAMAAQESFQNIALSLPEVFEGLDKKFIAGNWGTFAAFGTYVFGKAPQSLESHILNLKTKILYDEASKEYATLVVPPDPKSIKDVAKNLEFFITSLTKDNLGEDDKLKLQKMFAINSNGNVSVFADIEDSGLVFSDNTGFFKNLLKAAQSKYQFKFRVLNVKRDISEGIDNNIRGVALEEILPILSMQRKLDEFSAKGIVNKPLIKAVQDSMIVIKDKLLKLMQNYESWIQAHDQSALDPEDVKVINGVGALMGGNGSKLISAMVAASKDSISVRQPDFILTKGREVGEGRRQDTFEIFSDFTRAKIALSRMGYTEQEIMLQGMIKAVPVEEAFSGREDMLAVALKSGVFQKGQQVFYSPVSLKNYLTLDKAVFGTTTVTSNKDFINGVSKDPQNLFLKKFQEIAGPLDPASHKKVMEYNDGLMQIWDQIGKVPSTVKARSSTGSLVNSKPFKEFIKNTVEIIKSNSTFDELNDVESEDNPKTKLTSMINKYLESEEEDEALEHKIKAYTAQYAKNAKLISDVNKGDLNAKRYLSMKLFNTGGSVDDGMVCDYRGLASRESYNFRQNDVIRDVIKSFMSGDGAWTMKAKNNTFIFYNTQNPKMRLTMIDKVEKKSGLTGMKYSTKTAVEVNREILKTYNRRKAARESIIDNFMEYQKRILLELVGLKEEAV